MTKSEQELEILIINALYGKRDGAFTVDMGRVKRVKALCSTITEEAKREARIEAIASYKKVNNVLENEIRIDELKSLPVLENPIDYEIAIEKRIAELQSKKEVK